MMSVFKYFTDKWLQNKAIVSCCMAVYRFKFDAKHVGPILYIYIYIYIYI